MKYIAWGAGQRTTSLIKIFGRENIIAAVDSNKEKWGDNINGIPIISPKELYTKYNDHIVIVTPKYGQQEIQKELKEHKIEWHTSIESLQWSSQLTNIRTCSTKLMEKAREKSIAIYGMNIISLFAYNEFKSKNKKPVLVLPDEYKNIPLPYSFSSVKTTYISDFLKNKKRNYYVFLSSENDAYNEQIQKKYETNNLYSIYDDTKLIEHNNSILSTKEHLKIVIATVQIPFISGGAEFHATNLKNALIKSGHEAEIVTMPFADNPYSKIEEHIIAARMMNLENSWGGQADLCIGLKFPAYYMPHPNKVIWALHQHRAAYELFDTKYGMPNTKEALQARSIIFNADNEYLREAKRIYANSKEVSRRMLRFNNIYATPLYHPCPDMDKFYAGSYGDYILMPSRINPTKRQKLALESLSKTKEKFKLVILGAAPSDDAKKQLLDWIKEFKLEDKVEWRGYVSQEEKLALYAGARAVLFIPFEEDYGYITLEAMSASKAVITTSDSGGPLEFIENGKSGIVVSPKSKEIAQAMDSFFKSKNCAREFGINAKTHLDEMEISWEKVVKELLK